MDSNTQAAPLTGLAVGDALGMPFETAHFLENRLLDWKGDFQHSDFHKLFPGQWTDDTMMARTVAASLVDCRGYNPADIAQRYTDWYDSKEHRGMGSNTRQALRHLSNGAPWVHSGVVNAEGNAPAMRGVAIGVYYRFAAETLVRVAASEATITHESTMAQQGSIAAALGVAHILNGTATPVNLAQKVAENMVESPIKYRLLSIQAKAKKTYERPWQELAEMGTGAHILQTIPAAFFAFMVTSNFRDAIETSIRAGGDTDSTAALAGALAGSYYGREQVDEYIPRLEDADNLLEIERALLKEAFDSPWKKKH